PPSGGRRNRRGRRNSLSAHSAGSSRKSSPGAAGGNQMPNVRLRTSAALAVLACAAVIALPAAAQRMGGKSGVGFADPTAHVEGPKTIAGTKAYESPLPFFKDLKAWDPAYKAPRTADGRPDLQGVWSSASLTTMTRNSGRNAGVGVNTLV